MVVQGLAADDDVVLEYSDLSPDGGCGASSLRETAKVSELATFDNL